MPCRTDSAAHRPRPRLTPRPISGRHAASSAARSSTSPAGASSHRRNTSNRVPAGSTSSVLRVLDSAAPRERLIFVDVSVTGSPPSSSRLPSTQIWLASAATSGPSRVCSSRPNHASAVPAPRASRTISRSAPASDVPGSCGRPSCPRSSSWCTSAPGSAGTLTPPASLNRKTKAKNDTERAAGSPPGPPCCCPLARVSGSVIVIASPAPPRRRPRPAARTQGTS